MKILMFGLILCKNEAKWHQEEQMASLEAEREIEAKLLGPIHPPDNVSGLSGSGCAGAIISPLCFGW